MIKKLRLIGLASALAACSSAAAPAPSATPPSAPALQPAESKPPASSESSFTSDSPKAQEQDVPVDGAMKLIVKPSTDEYGQIHEKALSRKDRGFDKLLSRFDKWFVFPRPLPVVFEDCGKINAFYLGTEKSASIHMCYELMKDFDAKAHKARPDWDDRKRMFYVVYNTLFVFYHEFGHALHKELKLPVTGKGEDAADEIATLIALRSEQGQEIALAAAAGHQMAAKAKTDAGMKPNYFDEHSLSEQRFFGILCLMYGAQPDKYGKILEEYKIDKRRMAICKREYQEKRETWMTLLKPHVTGDFKL